MQVRGEPGRPQLVRLSRRNALGVLLAGGVLAACQENPVTGRTQLMLVSDEQLAAMGAQAWTELKAQTPLDPDARVQARIQRLGAKVAEASGGDPTAGGWEFVVFDSPEINAFVLPGGKVGFYRGLVDLAGSDDELAAVMGHEVGHVTARHAAERLSQQMGVQAAVTVASLLLHEQFGQWSDEVAGALGVGAMYGVILPYSRAHEHEADRLGLGYMARAAYNPEGAPIFWQRMMALSADRSQPLALLSTHPSDAERLERLRQEIAKL